MGILSNGLTYPDFNWKTEGTSVSETPKSIDFADFATPGQPFVDSNGHSINQANITNYTDLKNWLTSTTRWLDDKVKDTTDIKETIVNNIWVKHQKVPYNNFPPNIQETLMKLKKQDILTDLDSLTFEMARVLTILDAANEFNKPTFSFVAVGAKYDIDRHKLSFDATLNSFPWNEDTRVRLTTEASQIYAYFTSFDKTTVNFQVNKDYATGAKELADSFKKFQTIQLTKGVGTK